MADTLTLRFLRFLPKNLISRGFGWIARRERPRFLVRPFMRWFVRRFDLDLGEAARPFETYPSLLALFTRELRPGARPLEGGPRTLCNPVDARVGAFGRVESGTLFQAKGMDYSLEALLGSAEEARRFEGGAFLTLYLSPRDYHRLHSPAAGTISATLYEPGTLWPVNPPAVRTIPSLFAVNERVTAILETEIGPVAYVMVGATNVGSIRLAYRDFVSNRGGARFHERHDPPRPVERGGHLGTFELGSTVVLVVGNPDFTWRGLEAGAWMPLGREIGGLPD
ncbi:MAG: archaetidylserine decarboxylase [Planctomycetota bacterium]